MKTQGPVTCDNGAAPLCDGTTLILCVDGLESLVLCADGCAASPEAHCAVCGDGIVEGLEVCEPAVAGVACATNCQPIATCGDSILQPGEECDDNNTNEGDGCSDACLIEFCGDGAENNNEECDPTDPSAPAGCRADCRFQPNSPACGDGVPDAGEVCDDGNIRSGDGCSFDCLFAEGCGNGVLDVNETCELDGNCNSCQQEASCGDGAINPGDLCLIAPSQEASVAGTVTASAEVFVAGFGASFVAVVHQTGGNVDVDNVLPGSSIVVGQFPETNVTLDSSINFLASGTITGTGDDIAIGIQDDKKLLFVDLFGLPQLTQSGVFNALPNTNDIQQIALKSINEDALGELLVLQKNGELTVLTNTTGAFENIVTPIATSLINPIIMETADFDGDGKTDVVIASNGDNTAEAEIRVLLSTSVGSAYSFALSANITLGVGSFDFVGLVARDFDADGDLDLVAAAKGNGNATDTLLVVPNIGSASAPLFPVFALGDTPLIDFGGVGVATLTAQDVNADGIQELIASGDDSRDVIFLEFGGALQSPDAFSVLARYALRNRSREVVSLETSGVEPALVSVFNAGVEGLVGRH